MENFVFELENRGRYDRIRLPARGGKTGLRLDYLRRPAKIAASAGMALFRPLPSNSSPCTDYSAL